MNSELYQPSTHFMPSKTAKIMTDLKENSIVQKSIGIRFTIRFIICIEKNQFGDFWAHFWQGIASEMNYYFHST